MRGFSIPRAILLATLALASFPLAGTAWAGEIKTIGEVVRLDPRLDEVLPRDAQIEVLAHGFAWAEGPVWVPRQGGYLLFSDIPRNAIWRWSPKEGLSLFMKPAGYTGEGPWSAEPGTNGLALDPEGRLVMCEHGNRRITVLVREKDAIKRVLVSHYKGKRLNSPNDLVFKSNGDLYFTDPPYGLPRRAEDPHRELDFFGVYRLSTNGKLTLLTKEMTRPNGIGFSPDEKTLYVAQSDPNAPLWKAFEVKPDGTLGHSRVLYNATKEFQQGLPGLPDGMAVARTGHVFATGPGGVYVFHPDGTLLGRIDTWEKTANCCFGGPDGDWLYMTADMYLCRIKTRTQGFFPFRKRR